MREIKSFLRQSILPVSLVLGLVFVPGAGALNVQIVNQSGLPDSEVFVTVAGSDTGYDVPGIVNNSPVPLNTIPGNSVTVNKLVSGRLYIAYGAGVTTSVPFDSPTRFDWAEFTVTPNSSDVANLTAVDQFGIGMRLNTFNASGDSLEELGSANSDTVFNALQTIPGGDSATVRSGGNIVRVLSPNHTSAYPLLDQYVQSMSGRQISLHTAFYGTPFTTSSYSGTFQSDGSIVLNGSTNPPGMAPAQIDISGSSLINDIYTGGNTPNNLSGAIFRDLLAGFSTGLWGGKYGNSSLSFCSNPMTTSQGQWCPNGFNQPAFGDARTSLLEFPTCEQYSAVINQYSDSYGNPYSDASKKVTVSIDQPVSGGEVSKLQLTVLPDQGSAKPVQGGNPNCGAAAPVPPKPEPVNVKMSFYKKAVLKGKSAKAGKVKCSKACGQIKVIAKQSGKQLAYRKYKSSSKNPYLTMNVNKAGRRKFKKHGTLKVKVYVWVTPSGSKQTKKSHKMKFVDKH